MAKTDKTETSSTPTLEAKSSTLSTQPSAEKLEERLFAYLSKSLDDVGKAQKKQAKTLEESLRKLKEREIDPLREELSGELIKLKDRSDRTIETIGIFAALLSFVTFEAQIFKSDLNGWTLVGLSSLLLGALLLFVFALSNAFNPSKKERWGAYLQPLVVIPSLLVLVGLITATIGYNTDSKENNDILEIQEMVDDLKLQYSKDNTVIEDKINEIEQKFNSLSIEDREEYLSEFKDCIRTRGLAMCL